MAGAIIGGLLGGVGSIIAGNRAAKTARDTANSAASTALTGYRYLTSGAGAADNKNYMANGMAANNETSDLLGLHGAPSAASQTAFQNYLGSTGYNFQLQQGTNGVASQQAASGMLNSGATGKALEQYGQNLGSSYFNNYLSQLQPVSSMGQASLFAPANNGTSGGSAATNAISNQGTNQAQAQVDGIGGLFGGLKTIFANSQVQKSLGI